MAKEDLFVKLVDLLRAVSDRLDADVILYSGVIRRSGGETLLGLVKQFRTRPNVLLYLTTFGGDAHAAYRIARCLQRAYDGQFILFVDEWCKSAGTLIALGADELVMSVTAELGPLDVQLTKPDEIEESTSGLTPKQAITTMQEHALRYLRSFFLDLRFGSHYQITTKTALDVATNLTSGLFSPVFGQLDPMRLGEIQREMLVATAYGERLCKENENESALRPLVENYPSHMFVIDREEAEDLFGKVRKPSDDEEELAALLHPFVEKGMEDDEPEVRFLTAKLTPETKEPTGGTQVQPGDAHDMETTKDRSREVPEGTGGDGSPSNAAGGAKEGADTEEHSSARSSANQ